MLSGRVILYVYDLYNIYVLHNVRSKYLRESIHTVKKNAIFELINTSMFIKYVRSN